jgi:hypothetical protein|tara:strand:+ start:217 stop:585 length:369 start_codon:yes stop_codon:yes gene_type:complete
MADLGKFQEDITDLSILEQYRYENIFKIYETGDKDFFYYNILKKIKLPDDIDDELFTAVAYNEALPITTLSYRIYGTTYLWWLIMVVNNITNPAKIASGRRIKYIKKQYLKPTIDSIKQQLQ